MFSSRRSRAPVAPLSENARRIALLRTRILREMREKEWMRLAIVPISANAGATTITTALAETMHRQEDLRLLLVDFNLAKPNLAASVLSEGGGSFSKALREGTPFKNLLRPVPNAPSVTLLAPDRQELSGAEFLQKRELPAALADVQDEVNPDIVLIDCAALLESDLGLSALPHADAILLVANGADITARDMSDCERLLVDQPPLIGIVLNNAEA